MSRRVHYVMSEELLARIDAAALAEGVSRGEFVRRAVERALGSTSEPAVARATEGSSYVGLFENESEPGDGDPGAAGCDWHREEGSTYRALVKRWICNQPDCGREGGP